jgi:hypothetical protein
MNASRQANALDAKRSTRRPSVWDKALRFDASPLENRWAFDVCFLDERFAASHHVGRKKNQPVGTAVW